MKRRFKLKINGESPRSLFLAFFLAKLKCDIYLYDFLTNTNSKKDNQIFLFSNFSKNLLVNFDIWKEFEVFSFGVNSIKLKDNLVSEELLLRTEDFSKKSLKTIGWTAKYSKIKCLLINKLNKLENVHFISNNYLIDESNFFDFEFNFNSYYEYPLSIFKRIDEQIIIFNVYLRGNVERRFYEIITTDGLLILIPINNNLYQIIWNNCSAQIRDRALSSKGLFLDNLTTLLPNELKVDQIIGDIKFLNRCNFTSTYFIKNNSINFNEDKFRSNTLYDYSFDVIIKNILIIYNFLDNNKPKNIKIYNKLGFYYLYRKYVELKVIFSFSNSLNNLFILNNVFSLIIRKLLFTLLKKINLFKVYFIANLINLYTKDEFKNIK
tara:strand:+ start:324 stop:1460 length:1137 start_codon:yes stop_codon:yes gene_type:complete